MKIYNYIKYFFYIAFNWNIRLALFVIYNEIQGERRYRINTTGYDDLKKLEKEGTDISHATIYMPVSYYLLSKSFRHYPFKNKNHFVDIGSGKGRSLCVAANKGFKKVTGVDFSAELSNKAIQNLERTKEAIPFLTYTVVNENAAYFKIPSDADCIFLFNPFDEVIMKQVVDNIGESLQEFPRKMAVVYANPLYKKIFIEIGFKEIYHSVTMHYLEVSVLKN
jgi:16S rRNA G966 N2-methylase RsmD